jgi:hypothetical protein
VHHQRLAEKSTATVAGELTGQTRTHYDEATYLKALQRRGSPLVAKAV